MKKLYAVALLLVITAAYFLELAPIRLRESHRYHIDAFTNLIATDQGIIKFSPFLTYAILLVLCVGILWLFFVKKKTRIRVAPVTWAFVVIAMTLCIGASFLGYYELVYVGERLVFLRDASALTGIVSSYPLYKSIGGLFLNVAILSAWIVAIAGITTALGMRVCGKVACNSNGERCIVSFALGSLVLVTALFVLSVLGVFSQMAVTVLLLACSFACRKQIKELFWQVCVPVEVSRTQVLLMLILLSFVAISIVEIITPIPFGWDDLARYQNAARTIALSGTIPNGAPAPWELFMSLGYLVLQSVPASLLISLMGGWFASGAFYILLKKLIGGSVTVALTLTTLFFTMPAAFFHTQDTKIDMPLLAVTLASVCALYAWHRSGKKRALYVAFMLLGFAFSIKYTALFAVVPLCATVAYIFFGARGLVALLICMASIGLHFSYILKNLEIIETLSVTSPILLLLIGGAALAYFFHFIATDFRRRQSAVVFLITIILFLAPNIPWFVKNVHSHGTLTASHVFFGKSDEPNFDVLIRNAGNEFFPQEIQEKTGVNEELRRYIGYEKNPIVQYALLPLHLTLNSYIDGIHVDIGYVWLAFALALLPFVSWRALPAEVKVFLGASLIFWFLWAPLANGIIWYGFTGFLGIAVFIGIGLSAIKSNAVVHHLCIGLLVLWFFITSTSRFHSFTSNPNVLLYTIRALSSEETLNRMLPDYSRIAAIVNTHVPTQQDPALLYRMGTSVQYLINNSFSRTLNDTHLDHFNYLYSEEDGALTAERLRRLGFKYLVLDFGLPSIDRTKEKTLVKKFTKALRFFGIDRNYKLVEKKPYLKYLGISQQLVFVEI